MINFFNSLYQVGNSVHKCAYGDPLEIYVTPDTCLIAIHEHEETIFEYKFKDKSHTYDPLEYAVVIGEIEAVKELIALGAKQHYSAYNFGIMIHFYIDKLDENSNPNLEMLDLLIDQIEDIKGVESNDYRTLLEHALMNMSQFKKIHWNVIETLLRRGATLTSKYGTSPFMVLKDSHNHKISYGTMMRHQEEEELFLKKLVKYLDLEKKYHPNSDSALTLEEFKLHTHHLHSVFARTAPSIDVSTWFSSMLPPCLQDLEDEASLESMPNEQEFQELKENLERFQYKLSGSNRLDCSTLGQQFIKYHDLFQALVKEGNFKACFDNWELVSITSALSRLKETSYHAQAILILLKKWGLTTSDDKAL